MPLYEYECEAGHRFEVIQKFADAPLEVCRVCQLPVRRLISSPAIHFKGTGWYITDYARKNSPDTAKGEAAQSASTATTKTEGTKTDTASTDKSSPSGNTASSGSTTATAPSSASKNS